MQYEYVIGTGPIYVNENRQNSNEPVVGSMFYFFTRCPQLFCLPKVCISPCDLRSSSAARAVWALFSGLPRDLVCKNILPSNPGFFYEFFSTGLLVVLLQSSFWSSPKAHNILPRYLFTKTQIFLAVGFGFFKSHNGKNLWLQSKLRIVVLSGAQF